MFIANKYSTFNEFIFFSEYSVLLNNKQRIRVGSKERFDIILYFLLTPLCVLCCVTSKTQGIVSSLSLLHLLFFVTAGKIPGFAPSHSDLLEKMLASII